MQCVQHCCTLDSDFILFYFDFDLVIVIYLQEYIQHPFSLRNIKINYFDVKYLSISYKLRL